MIHIPEYSANRFLRDISNKVRSRLLKIKDVHINIMLQNIELLSDIDDIPQEVVSFIKSKVPTFKVMHSKMAGKKYFANTCPRPKISAFA